MQRSVVSLVEIITFCGIFRLISNVLNPFEGRSRFDSDFISMHNKLETTPEFSSDHDLHEHLCLRDQGREWSKQIK